MEQWCADKQIRVSVLFNNCQLYTAMVCRLGRFMSGKMGKALKTNIPKPAVFIQEIDLKEKSAGCYKEKIYC